VVERDDHKFAVLDKQIFQSYFEKIGKIFEECSYKEFGPEFDVGSAMVPSRAVFTADEVAITCYKDGAQYGLSVRGSKPQGSTSGGQNFHITLMVTVCLSGYCVPAFVIFSNNQNLSVANNSLFIGSDPHVTFTSNESGSMTTSTFSSLGFECGTFYQYCVHFIKHAHVRSQLSKERHKVILFVDNHSSRDDPAALSLLRDNGVILQSIPPNSSFILQTGDTAAINKRIQSARREIMSDFKKRGEKINTMVVAHSIPSLLNTITPLSIYKAAETVGFHYGAYDELIMNRETIEQSVAKFEHCYLNNESKKRIIINKQNSIAVNVRTLKLNGLIPDDIPNEICDPRFINFLKTVAVGGMKEALRDVSLPPPQRTKFMKTATSKVNRSGDTLTSLENIDNLQQYWDNDIREKEESNGKKQRKIQLMEELDKLGLKLGQGQGGNIPSRSGFIKEFLSGTLGLEQAVEEIKRIRKVKSKKGTENITI
jgi:hypothetical protein